MPNRQKTSRKRQQNVHHNKRIFLIIASIFLLVLIFLFGFIYSKYQLIQKTDVDEKKVLNPHLDEVTLGVMKGYTTFAVFGIDARNNDSLGKGNLSDVIMVCNVNNETGEIRLVSVYRDTYLDINGKEKFSKINAAYSNGGPEQALLALNQNLDLNLTKYVTFNWKSVADIINILGGIDLEITKEEYGNGTTRGINGFIQATKEATGIDSMHLKGPGMQHLDGIQAVAYARLRLMDTDFQRTERQRKVIALAMDKAKQADLNMLIESVDTVFPSIMTNFSITESIDLVRGVSRYYIGETTGFPTKHYGKKINRQDYVIPQGLTENVAALHQFLFDNDDYQASASVLKRDQLIRQKADAASGPVRPAETTKTPVATSEAAETDSTETTPLESESDYLIDPDESSSVDSSDSSLAESSTDDDEMTIPDPTETSPIPNESESTSRPNGEEPIGPGESTSPMPSGPPPTSTEQPTSTPAPTPAVPGPSGPGGPGEATEVPPIPSPGP